MDENVSVAPEVTTPEPPPAPNGNKRQLRLVIIFIVIIIIGVSGYLLLSTNHTQTSPAVTKSAQKAKPVPAKLTALARQMAAREHVNDQKNNGGNGKFASGFLNPDVLTKPLSRKTVIPEAFAAGDNEHPFIFYIDDRSSVRAFDTLTSGDFPVFSVREIPSISLRNGTAINYVYFVNSSKKIVFQLQQRLDDYPDTDETVRNDLEKFKTSVVIFDLKTRKFNEIVSQVGGDGLIAGWSRIFISPNEQHLFFFFNNQGVDEPFADVTPPPQSEPHASKPTYFFYDLSKNVLDKFKIDKKLSGPGTVTASWLDDSTSVVLGYVIYSSGNVTRFVQIYLDGHTQTLFEKKEKINHYLKSFYLPSLKRIFYIGNESSDETQSIFGFADIGSSALTTITTPPRHSLNFIYDYTSGFIYTIFDEICYTSDCSTGGIDNVSLNYYDIKTAESRKIIDQKLTIINFNGDYSHLLVSSYVDNKHNKLYDLDLKANTLTYLSTIPYVFSVFPDE